MASEVITPRPRSQRAVGIWVAVVIACVTLVALAIVWTFLGMRAVMDVGGSCADGGPYVSAQPCPSGAGLVAAGVPMMIILAMGGSGAAMAISAPNLLLPMWVLLFGSLGWNFLDYGAFDGHVDAGYLVCGIVFELMALPVLLMAIPAIRLRRSTDSRVAGRLAARDGRRVMAPALWYLFYAGFGAVGALLGVWSFDSWT